MRQNVWRDTGTALMRPAAPPDMSVPSDVLDLYADGDGVLAAMDHGISRSTDSGRHWHTVLRHVEMSSVTRGPTGYAALGVRRRDDRAVTATSRDGVHWTTVVAARHDDASPAGIGYALVLDGDTGVAVSRPNRSPGDGPMMRTTDSGRHWQKVRRFGDAEGGLQMSASGTIVATASGQGKRCVGEIYRSIDLGATWSRLPGSCSPLPLTGVQFVDATHAVAVGGIEAKVGGGRIIETTADGGLNWQVTNESPTRQSYRSPDGFGGVDFLTPTTGFVFGGVCVDSLGGPCGGDLYWTTDGGRHLSRLPDPAREGWLSIARTGSDRFVAAATGRNGHDAIGETTDGGHHWRLQMSGRQVDTYGLSGNGQALFWRNTLGTFVSHSAGRRWRPTKPLARHRHRTRDTHWRLRYSPSGSRAWVVHRDDSGKTLTAYRMPLWVATWGPSLHGTGGNGAVFAKGGDLWRTTDGGATWQESWPRLRGERWPGRVRLSTAR
jgi:photosystem II stability/assembly factor-like uncharacterized protein